MTASLLTDALQPYALPALLALKGKSGDDGISDLITARRRSGYLVSYDNSKRTTTLEFGASEYILEAVGYDISRFATSSFQTICTVPEELNGEYSVPWSLIRIYYSAFYSAHSLVRIFGESCTYLERSHTTRITSIGSAMGLTPAFNLDKGVYHFKLNSSASGFCLARAGGSFGGSHETFWDIFLRLIKSVRDGVLLGPLPPRDSQAVFALLSALVDSLQEGRWLSSVRNAVQYKHSHDVWFPAKMRAKGRHILSRLASQWLVDPLDISLQETKSGELGKFISACSFIVALCRCIITHISERSAAGAQSFTAFGPMKFLRVSGFAQ